jgi:hypothetical protein
MKDDTETQAQVITYIMVKKLPILVQITELGKTCISVTQSIKEQRSRATVRHEQMHAFQIHLSLSSNLVATHWKNDKCDRKPDCQR